MFACPKAPALPGPSTTLDPRPPFYELLRAGLPDHHPLPKPRYKPQRCRPKAATLRQRDVAEFL